MKRPCCVLSVLVLLGIGYTEASGNDIGTAVGLCSNSRALIEKSPAKPLNADAKPFVGRWKIIGDKGAVACYFTLSDNLTAKKSHVPDATGVWEVVGNEARITWSDGWKDILRVEKDGVTKIAFGPKTTWTDPPANTQKAVKEAKK